MKTKVSLRKKGFLCLTAHPQGCKEHINEQIDYVKKSGLIKDGPKNVLVIGASTGYGLASRIVSAFACKANTLGVFFERPSVKERTASAGWYNSVFFEQRAKEEGLWAKSVNGDAFSNEIKDEVVRIIKDELGQKIDLIVYSLASPRRTDPKDGKTYSSCLKTIGEEFKSVTLDTDAKTLKDVSILPASKEEIDNTIKVMGGEDWSQWIEKLDAEDLLAQGAQTVAYSYIGPKQTHAIYRNGTIGKAKEDLENTAQELDALMKIHRGKAFVSINKALVTQASSAIPVVPLYISILFKIMKQKGLHEDCIEQIYRLFSTQMFNCNFLDFDENGLVRIDDWEMREDVQAEVEKVWKQVTKENLYQTTDFEGYEKSFLKLFGFGLDNVNYDEEVEIDVGFDN